MFKEDTHQYLPEIYFFYVLQEVSKPVSLNFLEALLDRKTEDNCFN